MPMKSAEIWHAKLEEYATLPFGGGGRHALSSTTDREDDNGTLLHALELQRLEFKQIASTAGEFALKLFFYDFQCKCFGGSQFTVPNCSVRDSRTIQLDREIVFRTFANTKSLAIVCELVDRHGNALCWTLLPLNNVVKAIQPTTTTASTSMQASTSIKEHLRQNFPLFAGSCRVLLLTAEFNRLEPQLQRLDAIIVVSIRLLPDRAPAMGPDLPECHFFPLTDYMALCNDGNVLFPTRFTAILDNLRVRYKNGGRLAARDAFVLDLLAREYCYAMNRKWEPAEPTNQLRVLERRLQIGAHNGIGYVEEPICVLLELMHFSSIADGNENSAQMTPLAIRRRTQSLGRIADTKIGSDFGVRQNVRFRLLPIQPDVAIVFELYYLVGSIHHDAREMSTNTRLIRVAIAVWCPCANDGQLSGADTVTLQLIGGPRPTLPPFGAGGGLCLRDMSVLPTLASQQGVSQWHLLPPDNAKLELHFNFVPLTENDDRIPMGFPHILPSPQQQQQRTPAPRADRVPVPEDDDQQQQQTKQQSPLRRKMQSLPSTPSQRVEEEERREKQHNDDEFDDDNNILWPMSEQRETLPSGADDLPSIIAMNDGGAIRVQLPQGRVNPLPRPLISRLSAFPPVINVGNVPAPKPVDLHAAGEQHPTLSIERAERRWPASEVSIQFLAFMPTQNGFPRPAQTPPHIFFTFEFYRFDPMVTECLFAEPIDGKAPEAQQPMPLWREGSRQPGLTVHFRICPEMNDDFAGYLHDHQLHMHVWEADTLFHLGIASVPLKFLLRQGSPAIQCSLQCHVFQAGFPPDWCPTSSSTTTSTSARNSTSTVILNGLVFLRLANVGISAAKFNQKQKSTNEPMDGRRVIMAQSLRLTSARCHHSQLPLERFLRNRQLDLSQQSVRMFGPEEEQRYREWQKLKEQSASKLQLFTETKQQPKSIRGQKFLFDDELAAYRALRRESKALALLKAVFQSITTKMCVRLTIGELHHFAFEVRNPLAEECVCLVESNDPRLSPITKRDELALFWRQQQQQQQQIVQSGRRDQSLIGIGNVLPEEFAPELLQIANDDDGSGNNNMCWRLAVRSMESLHLPMRFDPGMAFDGGNFPDATGIAASSRLFVRRIPDGQPLAILELDVQLERPFLAQHLRWHCEAHRKLIRVVQLPKAAQSLRCSDPTVYCQLQEAGRLLRIECQTADSPHIREFHIFLFNSPMAIELAAVWLVSIHSIARLHAETVQGQPVRVPLPMPQFAATQPSSADGDLIRMFCTPPTLPTTMHFHPGPAIPSNHLGAVQLALQFSIGQIGRFHLLISAVRSSTQQPLAQWLLCVMVGQPNVTKVFQVMVPAQVQNVVHKRIPLHNPLAIPRQFLLTTSDPTLISIPDPSPAQIAPNASVPIQVDIIPPTHRPTQCEALLFVQDALTGNQEEAFQLNIRFY